MASLFSLLDKPPPLNSALVGYFGRVVGSLLTKRPDRMHDYLQAHSDLLPKLVTHIDTTSIVEVVLRLVGADEVRSWVLPYLLSSVLVGPCVLLQTSTSCSCTWQQALLTHP